MRLHPKISRKQFKSLHAVGVLYGLALSFLRRNRNYAYTRGEIAKWTKLPVKKLVYPLSKLRKEGLVLHKHYYWMWKN